MDQQNDRIATVDLTTANGLADGFARDFENWRPVQPDNSSRTLQSIRPDGECGFAHDRQTIVVNERFSIVLETAGSA
jgi:hypothetical protein